MVHMADMDVNYRIILEAEFSQKKARNKRFSLRSFAKFLGVDVSYISKLRAGNMILSPELAAAFAGRLKLQEKVRKDFIISAAEEQKCHELYLIDPSLTDCDPHTAQRNLAPLPRSKNAKRLFS